MLEPGWLGGSAQALDVRHMATDDVLSCLRPEIYQWLFPAGLVFYRVDLIIKPSPPTCQWQGEKRPVNRVRETSLTDTADDFR